MFSPRTTLANVRVRNQYTGTLRGFESQPITVNAADASRARVLIAERLGFTGERAERVASAVTLKL